MKRSSPSKITSSHSTSLEACAPFVKFARKSDLVSKISLGIITMTPTAKGGSRRIKCTEEKACLSVNVRANRGLQVLRFYCRTIEEVPLLRSEMHRIARENHFEVQS